MSWSCPGVCVICEIRQKGLKGFFMERWTDAFVLGTHGYFLGISVFLGRPDLFTFGLAAAVGSWFMFSWVKTPTDG